MVAAARMALTERPRLAESAAVRERFGLTAPQMRALRKAGIIPDPLPGTRLYDLKAIERALDALGNPDATIAAEEQKMLAEARTWGK